MHGSRWEVVGGKAQTAKRKIKSKLETERQM